MRGSDGDNMFAHFQIELLIAQILLSNGDRLMKQPHLLLIISDSFPSTSSSHKARGGDDARERDRADHRNALSRRVPG